MTITTSEQKITMKDLKSDDPRWCTGCGDYTILVGLRKFMVKHQLDPSHTVHVSGIGCSGRIPHYLNTYGFHGIHGRAVPIALGVRMASPDCSIFIHSGDGDSLSIGGNHLLHGISKNFNCVYLLFDNQIYGLTKNQTSPTSQKGLKTQTQPTGSEMDPINPIRFALGAGASFVASTAEWMGAHMLDTIEAAYMHKGFSFVHIAQRCPKFNPDAWDAKSFEWLTFLNSDQGIAPEPRALSSAKQIEHDPTNIADAFKLSEQVPSVLGLFYKEDKMCYDDMLFNQVESAEKLERSKLLDAYSI